MIMVKASRQRDSPVSSAAPFSVEAFGHQISQPIELVEFGGAESLGVDFLNIVRCSGNHFTQLAASGSQLDLAPAAMIRIGRALDDAVALHAAQRIGHGRLLDAD